MDKDTGINKAIGFRVKQAREFRNLTQDELAELVDSSTSLRKPSRNRKKYAKSHQIIQDLSGS